ncbi:Aste57867_22259 [Aphanomyces stellatus]|uniref:Aste57867_22259 protein n=1 Tax=Aphanomyces stellatus TaxID=120398 RepID=A0A485LJP3_9STRA|nr:hypothetical protein As57867_022189 [Aphanomyces stellatus]VFT98926.1 Aste57867_22259 [Aphanomyces stellatus]
MFRHSWHGPPRIHMQDDVKDLHDDDDEFDQVTSYSLVDEDDDATILQKQGSIIPLLESKSFRNIPLLQDSNRVMPFRDETPPPRTAPSSHRRHSEFADMRLSEPPPRPASTSSIPAFHRSSESSITTTTHVPKVMTSGPERGFLLPSVILVKNSTPLPPPPPSSSSSTSSAYAPPPLRPHLGAPSPGELHIAYTPLARPNV